MAKPKKVAEPKSPKTIKISTLVISVAVIIGLILSFIGGIIVSDNYNKTVQAQAIELHRELKHEQ